MAQNDFKPFAIGSGANVTSQADWEALSALVTGFQSGKASSAQVNKAIRQASFISAALAQFVSDKNGADVLDDGDLPGFVTDFISAVAVQSLTRTNPFADIKADGTVNTALSNLGLGAGAPPIGIPFFWPLSAMPNTVMTEWADMVFLKLNDATFSATTYPKLALVWPGLKLTDTRGEFIRIWDDGRGVDSGRTLLSAQLDALQNMTGTARNGSVTGFINNIDNNVTGVFKKGTTYANTAQNTSSAQGADLVFDASLVARTASETRSRNISFNFLVRAK